MHWYLLCSLITSGLLLIGWGIFITHQIIIEDFDNDDEGMYIGMCIVCLVLGFLFPITCSLVIGGIIYLFQKKRISKLIEGE